MCVLCAFFQLPTVDITPSVAELGQTAEWSQPEDDRLQQVAPSPTHFISPTLTLSIEAIHDGTIRHCHICM